MIHICLAEQILCLTLILQGLLILKQKVENYFIKLVIQDICRIYELKLA